MTDRPNIRRSVTAAILALAALVGAGGLLINLYIEDERQRDLLQWETRLGLVADSKVDALARSLAADQRDLAELANNASLQLYLWQLVRARQQQAPDDAQTESAQQAYLRNLLLAAAERGGYMPDPATRVPANLPRSLSYGMALLDAELRPVVVTPGIGELADSYGEVMRGALAKPGATLVDLRLDAEDRAVVVIAVAVAAVSGSLTGGGAPNGVLVGVRSAEQELYPLLGRGPAFAEDSETLLVARDKDTIAFLSPTRDGGAPLRRSLPIERSDLAEVAAVLSPGGFVSLDNYRGVPVLQVSRRIRGLESAAEPWVLVQGVNARDALSTADERRRFLLATLSLLLFSIAALAVAAWRHGSSVRARHQAEELRSKAAKLQKQTDLLHTVTDNIDVLTVLMNRDQEVVFTNQATANAVKNTIAGIVGSPVSAVFGTNMAAGIAELSEEARRQRNPLQRVLQLQLGSALGSYQASFIPVERIGERRQLVLLVLSDVTDLRLAEQHHADMLRSLVSALSDAVDLHDPYSAHHANRMSEVARAVARELDLPADEQATLGLAATLANIGKIMLPGDLLTKTEPLTSADRELLQKHVDYSIELLKGLDFEGPVLDVIAQKQERLDGSGYPRGLTEEQMTLSGRILSVANAFVALVSARAYRQGMSMDDALAELLRGAGTQFDRRVIAALFHVVENRGDWSGWS
ncbi:MAG: PAS domain-containing protein [Chromatiales bacterium]|nr:PAS domain-containing protein [Chromatiales bacterium]